jgi:hypothetical protein
MDREPDGMDRLDLSPLDPAPDDLALERLVRRVRVAATSELLRRQRELGLEGQLVGLRRPVLAACAVLALTSAIVLWTSRSPAPATTKRDAVLSGLGVPTALAEWTGTTVRPTVDDLVTGGGRSQ